MRSTPASSTSTPAAADSPLACARSARSAKSVPGARSARAASPSSAAPRTAGAAKEAASAAAPSTRWPTLTSRRDNKEHLTGKNMEGPVTVAVTGPFASGKSTLVRLLGELPGTETASADEIVHHLLKNDRQTISRIVERFGEDVRGSNGIDRKVLGREVFGDAGALRDLEEILHPLVRDETDRRIEASTAKLFVAEIPLLFETGRGEDFDFTVAITVPEAKRRVWAKERGVDEAALRAVEARQLSGEEKARLADLVVQNDGDPDRLREQAYELGRMLSRERGSNGNLR